MANKIFTYKHTVYFHETNSMGGVVYFSNYVKWQGMVREAFLLQAVPECKDIMQAVIAGKVNMITVEEHSRFIQHAFFGDEITIEIYATEIRKLSFNIIFQMKRGASTTVIYTGWQKLAFDDFKGNFIPIPDGLLKAVLDHTPDSEYEKYREMYSKEGLNSGKSC